MSNDVTVDTSEVEAAINDASDELLAAFAEVVEETAKAVRQNARRVVPVDTGNLRDAITYRRKNDMRSEVYVDPTDAWYGHLVELGTSTRPERPFMGPAADMERAGFKQRTIDAAKKVADG